MAGELAGLLAALAAACRPRQVYEGLQAGPYGQHLRQAEP